MKKYFLPIGKRQEEVLLPEERVIYDIHGNESSVCEDVVAATTEAIRNLQNGRKFLQSIHLTKV